MRFLGLHRAPVAYRARQFPRAWSIKQMDRNEGKPAPPPRDWRHIHHSPWFWLGLLLCLAAIMFYVMSQDLSRRVL